MRPSDKYDEKNIHFDFISNPKYESEMEKEFIKQIPSLKSNPPKPCCPRFAEAVKSEEIRYAYQDSTEIDETSWFIADKWHIYFCPFCGKCIRGIGFGSYHQETFS
jgi:hypothetical protein